MIAFTEYSQENGTDIIREHNKKHNKKQQSLARLTLGIVNIFTFITHKEDHITLCFPYRNCVFLTGTVIKFPSLF